MSQFNMKRLVVFFSSFLFVMLMVALAAQQPKTISFKGTIYRGDKQHPVANALILLINKNRNEKSDKNIQTKTDSSGNFSFETIAAGKYMVSIRTWYDTQEQVPCKLLVAKTNDKNSAVVVMQEKDKYVEQIYIDNFSIKAGKELVKDFDIECHGLFSK